MSVEQLMKDHDSEAFRASICQFLRRTLRKELAPALIESVDDPDEMRRAIESADAKLATWEAEHASRMLALRERIGRQPPRRSAGATSA